MKQQGHPPLTLAGSGWCCLPCWKKSFHPLYSSSLNSSNSARVAAGEMECLATIAQYVKLGKTLKPATELTNLGEPAARSIWKL